MSVLIKGMQMPKSCYYCGFTDTSFINCQAFSPSRLLEDDCEERRPEWCPMEEVEFPVKYIVDRLPKTRGECYNSKWEPYYHLIGKTGRYVCKIDEKDCNLDEDHLVICTSCRWLKTISGDIS